MMRNKKKQEQDEKPYILQLPNHIIVEIFCKIPIKTLVKCRFVCKSWRRLFSNQQFTKDLFLKTPIYLLVIDSTKHHFLVDWDNASSPKDVALKVSEDLTHSRKFAGVCNGLLCHYQDFERELVSFYISNPITGESVPLALPIVETSSKRYVGTGFGFGYGPKTEVYKAVLLMPFAQKVMVLTVGSGSWRSIWYPGYHFEQENGIYVNGYLHWIGQCSLVIHSFNLESESFEQLPMPPCCLDPHKAQLNLGVFNGCLSITVRSSYYIRIWVMKNYGVKEYSWTREVDIREILGGLVKRSCDYRTRVLEYTKERQVLVLDNRLQSYSTPNEGFVKNEVDGIENIHDAAYVHIQSFVLLKDLIIRGSSLYVQRFRHDKKSGMFTSQLVAHNPRD